VQYNAGLESRIKYRFHFDDYTVPDLCKIVNIKIKAKGYKMTADAEKNLNAIIDKNTTADLRSKYNGRLTDNLLQWAADCMNQRLDLTASGEQLITLTKDDLSEAIKKFQLARPPQKKDPALLGGEQVEQQFKMWGIQHLSAFFVRAGYRQLVDLIHLSKQDIMALGVTKDAEVRRAVQLVERLKQEHRKESLEMDALFVDPDSVDVKTWLEKRSLGEFAKLFERHRVDFEVLGDLTYEDLKEMGLNEVGPRRRIHRQIVQWRDDREAKKADAIRSRMQVQENKAYLESQQQNVDDRLQHLKASLGESGYVTGLRPSSG